jgi:hypothetical protein
MPADPSLHEALKREIEESRAAAEKAKDALTRAVANLDIRHTRVARNDFSEAIHLAEMGHRAAMRAYQLKQSIHAGGG